MNLQRVAKVATEQQQFNIKECLLLAEWVNMSLIQDRTGVNRESLQEMKEKEA